MRNSNLFINIVMWIVILHFVVGIGYLLWKIAGPVKKTGDELDKDPGMNDEDE